METGELRNAVEENDIPVLKKLLSEGGDINTHNNHGKTPLNIAVQMGHTEAATELLKFGANVNVTSVDGETPLYLAAEYGREVIINILLQSTELDVTIVNCEGRTPLFVACERNHIGVVKELLSDTRCNCYIDILYEGDTPLHVAAKYGFTEIVSILLDKKASVDSVDTDGRTPLWVAVEKNHIGCIEVLVNDSRTNINYCYLDNTPLSYFIEQKKSELFQLFIEKGADIEVSDKNGMTALHYAAKEGMLDVVTYLLDKGVDVHIKTKEDVTPLHLAAYGSRLEIIKLLLEKGADVNARDNDGTEPIHEASKQGTIDVIQILIDAGANINAKTNNEFIPLHFAARHGNIEAASLLINNNAIVNPLSIKDCNYTVTTPLQVAVKNNKLNVAKLLINNGADINAHDPQTHYARSNLGGTLLHWAARNCYYSCLELIQFLVEHGANINAAEHDGRTALCLVLKHNKNLDVIKFLIDNGAYLNNPHGYSPLYFALNSYYSETDLLTLLVESGADVNGYVILDLEDNYSKKPLHIATYLHVVKFLIEKGADTNCTDNDGNTPLHYASTLPVVKCLVENGADVNITNNEGYTPLHLACTLAIASFLTENGANVNALNHNGYTPLHLAKNVPIAELLIEKGANITSITNDGKTVLHTIAEINYQDNGHFVHFFVKKGINVNSVDNNGNTPLHLISAKNCFDVRTAKCLLEEGADRNATNKENKTPIEISEYGVGPFLNSIDNLFTAIKNDDEDFLVNVKKLALQRRVTYYLHDEDGLTILHYAAQGNRREVVEFLLTSPTRSCFTDCLKYQRNVNALTSNNWTPLHLAAQKNNADIVKLLLKHGAIYNAITKQGETPLDITTNDEIRELLNLVNDMFQIVQSGNQSSIDEYLEKETVIVNARDANGYTLLHWAVNNCCYTITQELRKAGADITYLTNDDRTILHFAASQLYENIGPTISYYRFQAPLTLRYYVNVTTNEGITALHIASKNGYLELVEYLLMNGAIYNSKTNEGMTPLALSKNADVTTLLKLIHESFERAENGHHNVLGIIENIKSEWFLSVAKASDRENNTIKRILERNNQYETIAKLSEMEKRNKIKKEIVNSEYESSDDDMGFGLFD